MTKTLLGTVRGNTIEIQDNLGIASGQRVEVRVRVVDANARWGDGILKSAGGWQAYPEMDAIMEKIQEDRKLERRSQMEPR